MARVLILGGGFAAISAADTLSANLGTDDEIVLVSKSPDFTFFPAIIPMVFGDFKPDEIRWDLRPRLAERKIKFVQGEVLSINTESHYVTVTVAGDRDHGSRIDYDYLIVAVGRRIAFDAVPGFAENAHHLLSVEAAQSFKEAIAAFKEGSIVVGLCPDASLPVPVCESALALAYRFQEQIRNGKVSVTMVVPTTLDKAFAGANLFRDIEDQFDRLGVSLVSDFAVTRISENRIGSALGAAMRFDLLMLIPPFGGQFSIKTVGSTTDVVGFANVTDKMKVVGLDRVYAAGEIVSMPGPKFGYIAMRQGRIAAQNVLAELKSEEPTAEYVHKVAWAIGEKYTDPVYFHYGFWDDTLADFDEDALMGMAKSLRAHYGRVKTDQAQLLAKM